MRRICFACVCWFLLPAAAAWGSTLAISAATGRPPADHSLAVKAATKRSTSAASKRSATAVMFGQRAIASTVGRNGPGMARAFAFRSHMNGTVASINVYLDLRTRAARLLAGLYADVKGKPGARVTAGSTRSTRSGAWNSVRVAPATIKAGTTYWLVVLGRTGPLYFRHRDAGSCFTQTAYQKPLTSLPPAWIGGSRSRMCPISAYVRGQAAQVTIHGPINTVANPVGTVGTGPANSGAGATGSDSSGGGGSSTTTNPLPTLTLPPVNLGAPAISGTAQAGQTLSSSNGTWLDSAATYAYQWEDCDSLGNNCSNSGGATSSGYTLGAGDVGHTIRVVVTASNSAGSASSTSSQTEVVAAPPAPTVTAAPVVTGSSVQGQTLSTTNGTWSGSPSSYAYKWQDCNSSGSGCANISGATSGTYTLKAADVGHTVRSVVTASNAGGSASKPSAVTAMVSSSGQIGNTVLLGDQNLANSGDSNASGVVQAFSYTAAASGTTTDIQLYVASGTTTSELFVGLYTDAGGTPASLLASGSIASPTAGAWNDVTVGSATVTAGTTYWIALLGTGGQLSYLDTAGGSAASYVGSVSNLTSLPQTYAPGTEYDVSPASAYQVGVASAPPPPPAAPVNTAAPVITGSAVQGQVLSASTGSWSNSPTSYGYQWQDCDSSGGACSNVGGATSSSYTLGAGDVGHTVVVVVTASNAGGSASQASMSTAVVTASGDGGGGGGGGSQIYVAQSSAGSGSGADCGDAKSVSFFDNASSWGTGAGQIGPGVTVDLCGTISSALTAQGSGTSSSPITVLWQPGATMTSPDWGGGAAFDTNGQTHLTLNGGSNGSIQATQLGTGLADQGGHARAISADDCTGCTFENLTIANFYVHTSLSDTSVDQTQDNAIVFSGSHITVANNTIHDVGWALHGEWNNGDGNDAIYGNNIYNIDHGIASTSGVAGGNIGPIYIYDNDIHDFANWDTNTNAYHHDGIHCYTVVSQPGASHYSGLYIYDNRFGGTVGNSTTADIFMEGNYGSSGATPCSDASSSVYIFNNVFSSTDLVTDNPYLTDSAGDGGMYNNTVLGQSNAQARGGCISYGNQPPNAKAALENNILSNRNNLIGGDPTDYASGSPDYNLYASGGSNSFVCNGNFYNFGQFSNWQSCMSADTHSKAMSSAMLNSDGSPQSGSAAIGAGANLTSLCSGQPNPGLGALCQNINGTPRPTTGAWNAGAY